ncbi:Aklanonic acid methyltransferase DnrC [Diaporthe amygdali]|uniref:Aklanonic acid methyltransferase DnrC n=1 Tax=Phomopsis amygdali TaxID=1214568 RepID=UPI0022FE8619|nr:Aklanonic acid methyltransferase DnrC [Diaporthe amygdali]KAJ0124482.1 Aklanonic acid methyltransferase DnrC [Diaporthe amygdali]
MSTTTSKPSSSLDGGSAMQAILESGAGDEWQDFLIETMRTISAPLARRMLAQVGLGAGTTEPYRLLEQGCGMGVVAPLLHETVPRGVQEKSSVVCGDFSGPLVEAVKGRMGREGWVNCEAKVVDAQESGLPSESFTHVVGNIVYHTIPKSLAALKDSIRLLQPGGTFAVTTWHSQSSAWATDVRDAFNSLPSRLHPPNYAFHMPMQLTDDGHWDDVDWVRGALTDQGLVDVQVDVLATLSSVKSPEHFMKTSGMMVEYAGKLNLGLDLQNGRDKVEEVKELVKKHLVEKYGEEGKWTLTWVSIIASGRKPS